MYTSPPSAWQSLPKAEMASTQRMPVGYVASCVRLGYIVPLPAVATHTDLLFTCNINCYCINHWNPTSPRWFLDASVSKAAPGVQCPHMATQFCGDLVGAWPFELRVSSGTCAPFEIEINMFDIITESSYIQSPLTTANQCVVEHEQTTLDAC